MKNTISAKKTPKVPASLSWLFPYKRKGLSISTQSPAAYYLFQNKISLLLVNWMFQGMRSMSAADIIGKIMLEILFFSFFMLFINGSGTYHILLALVFAHTLNWLINAHFWDLGRYLGITRTPPSRFFPYIRKVMNRVKGDGSILSVIVIGGVSRNAGFRETSDVDMIFIKGKGFYNSLSSVIVTMRERVIAFFSKFPLHLELYDSMESVKHRPDEVPIVLKDVGEIVRNWYEKSGRKIACLDDYERQD